MLGNYFKIAIRNLLKHRGYTLINILGLVAGLACCILILLYVLDELRFDAFHAKAGRIFRVVEVRSTPDRGDQHNARSVAPLGPAMEAEFPEVAASVRMLQLFRVTMQFRENRFYEGDYLLSEPSFFKIFDFEFLRGNPETALVEPRSVVLTEAAARKYFGEEDPLGNTLRAEAFGDLKVTAILKDLPPNSHLHFSMLISFGSMEHINWWAPFLNEWNPNYRTVITYLLLQEPAAAPALAAKLPAFLSKHRGEADWPLKDLYLQPLRDIHFRSGHIAFERNHNQGEIAYIYIFSAIALLIVLIAGINYMNLAAARALNRAREVGVRKVVGASRFQLAGQFLSESLLLVALAFLLALFVVELVLPFFNAFVGKQITLGQALQPEAIFTFLGLTVLVGLLSGSYPAFFLSRLQAVRVLKGGAEKLARISNLRRALVVLQFILSVVMMIAALVVYQQMNYVRNKHLGFDREHLMVIDINSNNVRRHAETMKAEMRRNPAVLAVSVTNRVPGDWKNIATIDALPGDAPSSTAHTMYLLAVDREFVETYGVRLAAGENFSGRGGDSLSVLINEAAARALGWENPLGKEIRIPRADLEGGGSSKADFRARVIGVVEDFHFKSLYEKIEPLVLAWQDNPFDRIDYFSVKVRGTNLAATLDFLREIGERFDPDHPFEYNFLDERLNDFYRRDQKLGQLFGIAALLAIFIACMGLFGLAAFMAGQRTKEIGIRKALGATVASLIALLSKDFAKLVLIANLIAWPLAWYVMNRWLEDFAYRIEIGWWVFALAGALALLIALLTVSYQAIKAALANPVEALRYE